MTLDKFNSLCREAVDETADLLGFDDAGKEFWQEYVMTTAAEIDVEDRENPILKSGPVLDSLELSKTFVASSEINPILTLFSGDSYSQNSNLRLQTLVNQLENFL